MNDIILGQVTCPKCGMTYPTIGIDCPYCNPLEIDVNKVVSTRETVRISCFGGVFDNGTLDMAHNLMHVLYTKFSPTYNHETKQWDEYTYDYLALDFKDKYNDDNDEEFYMDPRPGYYTEEDIENWRKTQRVVFPPIQVYSVKVSQTEKEMLIEIETDNAYEVRKLFYLFADLGNGGHSFGGVVRINDDKYHAAYFGFDGDGSDRIYKIDEDDNL